MALILFDADVMTWSWQGFLLINLTGLIALTFWLGRLYNDHQRLRDTIEKFEERLEKKDRELTLLRGAYHHANGFLMANFPDKWRQYDFSRNREE